MSSKTAPRVSTARLSELVAQIETVIMGKRDAIQLALVGLLAEGHILLEDVPGTGKTSLARALARSLEASFQRIQFTSDLLPSDVLGVNIYSQAAGKFEFRKGPIFHHVVLADELNRTSPRTQSSLLECMSERKVSIDGLNLELPQPFFVIATQNPIEFEGTYPLPESQLDRFLLRLRLGYPDREDEREILSSRGESDPMDEITPVLSLEELMVLVRGVKKVRIEASLIEYLLDLIQATRQSHELELGASTRAALGLRRAAQAFALLEGRDYCVPDDFKRLFLPCLAHRVLPNPMVEDSRRGPEQVLESILDRVNVPH